MKKLFFLFLTLTVLSCGKDDGPQFRTDVNMYFYGKTSLDARGSVSWGEGMSLRDSVLFVAKYAFWSMGRGDDAPDGWARGFAPEQRDTINCRLGYPATDVIMPPIGLSTVFTHNYHDLVIVVKVQDGVVLHPNSIKICNENQLDTVAYIPNSVFRNAGQEIAKAYEEEDYEKCYELFDKAYVYIPITGEKWRALKAAGIE